MDSGIITRAQWIGDYAVLCPQPWQLVLAGAFLPARQTLFCVSPPLSRAPDLDYEPGLYADNDGYDFVHSNVPDSFTLFFMNLF
jgi:hypothetical protein